ncbi:cysteine desulfurase family protein [Gaetbulibacter saemankumensis]|uniref:cysteine desulfurase family protein n=1 Tax=Gaetbulibacter saemankumensis TaxID=311208 RepID=UPI00041FF0F5|nr:cysteine desulfurase family protein [Gaetbulibacter saemankumensis]
MKQVYFDNAATTPVREEVIDKMHNVLKNNFGNPSSSYSLGRSSKSLVEKSRKAIASWFNVSEGEIIFTSGGTESDNLILRSAVRDLKVERIITSKIEHHAVLESLEALKVEYNISVEYVQLDANGVVNLMHLKELLDSEQKTLVSLMYVNNEIGNLLDLKSVANICQEHNALFHTDAVQAIGHYNIDLQEIPIDFLAASAHKFHGPKGVGFAFIRKNSGLKPIIIGGQQERGLRAGTESVHNIVGLETALNLAYKNLSEESVYITALKDYFIKSITREIPGVTFNGTSADLNSSIYTIVNICLPMAADKAGMILFQLDLKGIACSRGSACQSGSTKSSHVLTEILSSEDLLKPSLRFSFSIYNTKEEVDYVIEVLKGGF